jgi:prepilin-type N-terminal cleavage/methylation domain-containing protein
MQKPRSFILTGICPGITSNFSQYVTAPHSSTGLQLKTSYPRSGFNIVEILVALALLGFGLYAAADLISSARRTSALTRSRIQAAGLAQLKLEELRCAGAAVCAAAAANGHLPGTVFEQNPRYAWSADLTPNRAATDALEVSVSVTVAGDDASTSVPLAKVHGLILCAAPGTKGVSQ